MITLWKEKQIKVGLKEVMGREKIILNLQMGRQKGMGRLKRKLRKAQNGEARLGSIRDQKIKMGWSL